MEAFDILTALILFFVTIVYMLGKYRISGEKFDIKKFGLATVIVLCSVGLVMLLTHGNSVQVNGSGLSGILFLVSLAGIGAVSVMSFLISLYKYLHKDGVNND